MKEKLRNKRNTKIEKGITLVALVVTIVVLLILAGVTIVTLFSENGIITKAQKAKQETENGIKNDLDDLADLESYINGNKWKEIKNGKGQVVEVKRGSQTIEIGNYVEYDCTNGGTETASYTSYSYENRDINNGITSGYSADQTFNAKDYTEKWRVLGANEKGELLIMSSTNVPLSNTEKFYNLSITKNKGNEQGKVAYKYAKEELDNISKIYAKGEGATGARSITVNDINKITGYEPEAPAGDINNRFGKGKLNEYGNEVTYSWKGEITASYSGTNGKTGKMGISMDGGGFTYWNINLKKWEYSEYTKITGLITSLKSTSYKYYPETLTTVNDTSAMIGIANNSSQREMLFGNSSSDYYWLGTEYIDCNSTFTIFGFHNVKNGFVGGGEYSDGGGLCLDFGGTQERANGVRPVVFLSTDIKLEKGETIDGVDNWIIK